MCARERIFCINLKNAFRLLLKYDDDIRISVHKKCFRIVLNNRPSPFENRTYESQAIHRIEHNIIIHMIFKRFQSTPFHSIWLMNEYISFLFRTRVDCCFFLLQPITYTHQSQNNIHHNSDICPSLPRWNIWTFSM